LKQEILLCWAALLSIYRLSTKTQNDRILHRFWASQPEAVQDPIVSRRVKNMAVRKKKLLRHLFLSFLQRNLIITSTNFA
jgi:hypothetical protein